MAIGKHATTIAPDDQGRLVVTYHQTQVVVCDGVNKTVKLDSGGYRTATTKKRINQALEEFGIPLCVAQRDFDWYVDVIRDGAIIKTLPFRDGDELCYM